MREYVFVAPVTNLIFFSIFNPIIYIKYLTIKDMFYLTCFFSIKAITNYQKSMNKVKKKKTQILCLIWVQSSTAFLFGTLLKENINHVYHEIAPYFSLFLIV